MMNRRPSRLNVGLPPTPLFFKLWFGFLAVLFVAMFAGAFITIYNVIDAGPEGIGRAVGSAVKGFRDAAQ